MASLSKRGSRIKGNKFELEVAKELSEGLGLTAERTLLSGIRGEGDVVGLPFHVECKRCESLKISEWFRDEAPKSKEKPFVLVYRKSREEARCIISLKDFIKLLQGDYSR